MNIVSRSEKWLGTLIEIKLPLEHSFLFSDCFKEIERIEKTYSRFLDSSELSKVNASLGSWVSVSDEFLFIVSRAQEIKKKTWGNFDITLKSTLDQLGYDKNYSFKESIKNVSVSDKLKGLLPSIRIDNSLKRIFLRKEIDFGGLGKGFALDSVARLLDEKNVDNYYINAGGDIFAKGKIPWKISLEHPDDPSKFIGELELNNEAIAASSSNRRKWGKNHHLINAKTKLPQNSIKAIFVIANKGIDADAYATALFTAGFDDAIILSQHLELKVLIISFDDKVFQSEDFIITPY